MATLSVACPRCGNPVRLIGTILTGPAGADCQVSLDIHPSSKRRHAGCFGGPGGGGEPLPIEKAA